MCGKRKVSEHGWQCRDCNKNVQRFFPNEKERLQASARAGCCAWLAAEWRQPQAWAPQRARPTGSAPKCSADSRRSAPTSAATSASCMKTASGRDGCSSAWKGQALMAKPHTSSRRAWEGAPSSASAEEAGACSRSGWAAARGGLAWTAPARGEACWQGRRGRREACAGAQGILSAALGPCLCLAPGQGCPGRAVPGLGCHR